MPVCWLSMSWTNYIIQISQNLAAVEVLIFGETYIGLLPRTFIYDNGSCSVGRRGIINDIWDYVMRPSVNMVPSRTTNIRCWRNIWWASVAVYSWGRFNLGKCQQISHVQNIITSGQDDRWYYGFCLWLTISLQEKLSKQIKKFYIQYFSKYNGTSEMYPCPISNPPSWQCLGCSYWCLRLPARWASASLTTTSNESSGFIHGCMWLWRSYWAFIQLSPSHLPNHFYVWCIYLLNETL